MINKKIVVWVLFLASFTIIFHSCSNPYTPSTDGRQEFSINVNNYSDNHYFLDTNYKSNFIDFENDGQLNEPANISRQVSNENFEVWVQTTNTTADRKFASMLIDLPPLSGSYDTSYYRPMIIQGKRYFGLFRKLSSTEYLVNYQAGFISLKSGIGENDYIGVSYKEIGTDKIYGTNSVTYDRDTLVLKMLKAGNINPQTDTLAWAMKMKNVYRLPLSNILQSGFEFQVNYVDPLSHVPDPALPNGRRLLEITGLDRYLDNGALYGQDGFFDYMPGRTIYTETGDIIFPVLEPFNKEILNAAAGDTSLAFKEIYTKLKNETSLLPKNSLYSIRGKARIPGSN